jgi:hypothetical protein
MKLNSLFVADNLCALYKPMFNRLVFMYNIAHLVSFFQYFMWLIFPIFKLYV